MAQIVRKEIQLDGVVWEYFECGQGKTLLLIPAFHSDINRFKPLVEYLSANFKVILPHLPGISNNQTLGSYEYTAKNYAHFLNWFVKDLKLNHYVLAGFCLGGVIIVRMFEQGLANPDHVLIFEGIYDADYIHLRPLYDFFKRAALKLGPKNRVLNSIVDLVLHDERMLSLYFKIAYHDRPNLPEIIKHQVKITKIMATRAYIEVACDIFNTHLSRESLVFQVPTTLIYNKYDNILDVTATVAGMQSIFPQSEVLQVDLTEHSPAGEVSLEFVERLIKPLEQKLALLKV